MNPGTTLGSIAVTYASMIFEGLTIEQKRATGTGGNAVEGVLGGVGTPLIRAAAEREPAGTVKPNVDDFNRSGLPPRFATTKMRFTDQVVASLRQQGIDVSGVEITSHEPDGSVKVTKVP